MKKGCRRSISYHTPLYIIYLDRVFVYLGIFSYLPLELTRGASFFGKYFIDQNPLHTEIEAKGGRWVYRGD